MFHNVGFCFLDPAVWDVVLIVVAEPLNEAINIAHNMLFMTPRKIFLIEQHHHSIKNVLDHYWWIIESFQLDNIASLD